MGGGGGGGGFRSSSRGTIIFFKFNQCCWQQWILNVLDIFNYVMSLVIMGFWNKLKFSFRHLN
jgi:hypothetical protein